MAKVKSRQEKVNKRMENLTPAKIKPTLVPQNTPANKRTVVLPNTPSNRPMLARQNTPAKENKNVLSML